MALLEGDNRMLVDTLLVCTLNFVWSADDQNHSQSTHSLVVWRSILERNYLPLLSLRSLNKKTRKCQKKTPGYRYLYIYKYTNIDTYMNTDQHGSRGPAAEAERNQQPWSHICKTTFAKPYTVKTDWVFRSATRCHGPFTDSFPKAGWSQWWHRAFNGGSPNQSKHTHGSLIGLHWLQEPSQIEKSHISFW